MSIELQLQGTVYKVGSPIEQKSGWISQNMILHIPDLEKKEYSDDFNIEWNQKGIENLQKKNIQDGDHVKVTAYLSGRKYQKATEDHERAFNSFKGFKIDKIEAEETLKRLIDNKPLNAFPILDELDNNLPF